MKTSVVLLALLATTAFTLKNDYNNCIADIHQAANDIETALHTHHVDPLAIGLDVARAFKDCKLAINNHEIPLGCRQVLVQVAETVHRDIEQFKQKLTKAALYQIVADLRKNAGIVEQACDKPAPTPSSGGGGSSAGPAPSFSVEEAEDTKPTPEN